MFEDVYTEFARIYDSNYSSPECKREDEELMTMISRFAIGRTLDIGCGTGLYLDYVSVPADQYLGIDPSQGMLDKAKLKHPDHKFERRPFEQLDPFTVGRFNTLVALYGVASYIRSDRYELITDLTKREGTYFLMAYKDDYFPSYYTEGMKDAVLDNVDHNALAKLKGARQFEFTNYLITTNAIPDLERAA